jgi:hypothetical protein
MAMPCSIWIPPTRCLPLLSNHRSSLLCAKEVWAVGSRSFPVLIVISVLVVSVGAAALLYRAEKQWIAARRVAAATNAAEARASIHGGADPPHIREAADAPIGLEEFGDFQCRPCGDLSPVLEKIEQDYGPRLRLIFRAQESRPCQICFSIGLGKAGA